MMNFLKSNIILILLIVFFSFIIITGLMKTMNIFEGIDETVKPTYSSNGIITTAPSQNVNDALKAAQAGEQFCKQLQELIKLKTEEK